MDWKRKAGASGCYQCPSTDRRELSELHPTERRRVLATTTPLPRLEWKTRPPEDGDRHSRETPSRRFPLSPVLRDSTAAKLLLHSFGLGRTSGTMGQERRQPQSRTRANAYPSAATAPREREAGKYRATDESLRGLDPIPDRAVLPSSTGPPSRAEAWQRVCSHQTTQPIGGQGKRRYSWKPANSWRKDFSFARREIVFEYEDFAVHGIADIYLVAITSRNTMSTICR